jgi:dihydroorotate dehydrogenase (fumarate)
MDTSTKFMGKTIKSPIIAGSCGKTADMNNLKLLEEKGAGAIILKSLFEEQITHEISNNIRLMQNIGEMQEAYTYIAEHTKQNQLDNYLKFIRQAKQMVGSNNCKYKLCYSNRVVTICN